MTFKTNQQLQNELKMLQGFILEWFSSILELIEFWMSKIALFSHPIDYPM